MDVAFARAVRAGTNAIHRGDPVALAALEAQAPGWGGYDYGQLAPAVDAMEIYDMGNAIEIARSLNPNLRVLVTCFGADAAGQHHLWRDGSWARRGPSSGMRTAALPGRTVSRAPRGALFAPIWREQTGALGRRSCWTPILHRDRLRSFFLPAGQLPDDLASGPAPGPVTPGWNATRKRRARTIPGARRRAGRHRPWQGLARRRAGSRRKRSWRAN